MRLCYCRIPYGPRPEKIEETSVEHLGHFVGHRLTIRATTHQCTRPVGTIGAYNASGN